MTSDEKDFVEVEGKELPLATRDETPPLMLDLPDGQQLVVGKLPDGIVIEIATWRGTGRPDSRTNRMMLGVSYDEDDESENIQNSKKKLFSRKKADPALESSAEPVEVVETHHVAQPTLVEIVEPEELVEIAPEVPPTNKTEKLEEVKSEPVVTHNRQDLFGARPRTQVITQDDRPNKSFISRSNEIVKSSQLKNAKKISLRAFITPALWIGGLLILAYLFTVPGEMKFTHPDGGLKTSLSSASDAVIVVKKSGSYAIGDNVVAVTEGKDSPTIFGSVAALSEKEIILTENNLYYTTNSESIEGKVLLVIPGLGALLNLFH